VSASEGLRRTGSFLRNDWKKFSLLWRGRGPGRIPRPRGDLARTGIGASFLEDPWPLPVPPEGEDPSRMLQELASLGWTLYGSEVSLDPPGDIPWLSEPVPGEPRAAWELNRLAVCYFLVCPESPFAQEDGIERCRGVVDSWSRANPYCRGTNWSNAMEAAVRLLHLVWVLAAVAHRDREKARELAGQWWPFLCAHADFIRDRLSLDSAANNHLLLELVALLVFDRAANPTDIRWMKGLGAWEEELGRQLERQFDANGIDREHSSGYQRFVVQALELLYAADRGKRLALADRLEKRIRGGRRFLEELRIEGGGSFSFGDGDGGTLFEGWSLPGPEPGSRPAATEISGYLFARSGGWETFLDAAEDGLEPLYGHVHSDLLSFQAAYAGTTVVADPGTYGYLGDPATRDYLRSRQAHAVFSPAGWDPVRFRGPFLSTPTAGCREAVAEERSGWSWIWGRHDLHPDFHLERGILCGPGLGCLVIDRAVPKQAMGSGPKQGWEGRVRFAPGWKPRSTGEGGWMLEHRKGGPALSFRFGAPGPVRQRVKFVPFSSAFLALDEALSVTAVLEADCQPLLLTCLTPADRPAEFHWHGSECRIETPEAVVTVRGEGGSPLTAECGDAPRFRGG
jgi:hypothetical protein